MYICICNAITDKDIREAQAEGVSTHDEVFAHFNTAPRCGRCIETMCDRLNCCQDSDHRSAAA
jgi:bacterioferritin-associated ferredoxin